MGFKPEQFVTSVDENLICSICHEVFEDPVSCKDGHTFCKDCVHVWLKKHRKCPMDSTSLAKRHLVHLLTVRGIIDNLEVYCQPQPPAEDTSIQVEDSGQRCDWAGKLQDLTQHQKTCPFLEVQCSHVQCNQKIQRRNIEEHQKICNYRKVDCEKCGMVLIKYTLEKHIRDDCLQFMVICPNLCRDKGNPMFVQQIKRVDLTNHLSTVCPKALINCPYREQGCAVKVAREDVEKHVQENMAAHMMLLAVECSSLRKQNKTLTDQCSIMTSRCSTVTQANVELKHELKKVKDNFENKLADANTYTWTVHDYPTLSKQYPNGSWFRSPTFCLCGHSWFLKIFPNGDERNTSGNMSLFLNLIDDDVQPEFDDTMVPCGEVSMAYRIKLISKDPGAIDFSVQGRNDFCKTSAKAWGWKKFKKADDVLSRTYCSRYKGCVTIHCTIQLDK